MGEKEIAPKVAALFDAVGSLILEGADVNQMKVVDITNKAGIGKGTAYEYFSNKEELIAEAVLYQLDRLTQKMEAQIKQTDSFTDAVELLLKSIEDNHAACDCIVMFMQKNTEATPVGKVLQYKMKQEQRRCMPDILMDCLIERGEKQGELQLKKELPGEYIRSALFGRFIGYVLLTRNIDRLSREQRQLHHKLTKDSIIQELCYD